MDKDRLFERLSSISFDELIKYLLFLKSIEQPRGFVPDDVKITDLSGLLYQHLQRRQLTQMTIMRHVAELKRLSKYCETVADLYEPDKLQSYLEHFRSVKSYNNAVNMLHHLAEITGIKGLKEIRYKKAFLKSPELPSIEELKRFRSVLAPKHKLVFDMLLSTGLRIFEVYRLKKSSLRPYDDMLYLVDAWGIHKIGANKQSFFSFTPRNIALRVLDYAQKYGEFLFMKDHDNPDEYAFYMGEYTRMEFCMKGKRINVKISPHILRKVWASESLRSGMPMIMVDIMQGRLSAMSKSYIDVKTLAQNYREHVIPWLRNVIEL